MSADLLSIGDTAARSGVATSALRFYEDRGLITSTRTAGGQRRFHRDELRRIAFIKVAQSVGLPLADIRDALGSLPTDRSPNKRDWERLSRSWRERIDTQIELLTNLRDELDSCIGCGCLSLRACALYNPSDVAARFGSGPRYLVGDQPPSHGRTPPN